MGEQLQESEMIVSCQKSLRLKWGMHQGSVLSPYVFVAVVDAGTELERGCST